MPRHHDSDTSSTPSTRSTGGNHHSGVPFVDAHPETNEVPLDQLDNFIVTAQDQNHISEPVSFRIPPFMKRYAKIIVASGRFPYLDIEDFIRHAFARHVEWLCTIRQSLPQHIRVSMTQQIEVCADDEMRMQVEQVFTRAEERIKYHMARGDMGEVVRLVNLMREKFNHTHASARMREFKERFDKTYCGYLQANRGVNTVAVVPALPSGALMQLNGAVEGEEMDGEMEMVEVMH
jgi:hypothetical protein